MTITTTTNRITYNGNGATTVFAVPFQFFGNTEIQVIEKVTATGVETLKTLTTHYTVSGGAGATGDVTMLIAPPTGTTLTVARKSNRTQAVDYVTNDPFPANTHELALDRLTTLVQELFDDLDRSARLSVASALSSILLPDPVTGGEFIRWNSGKTNLELATIIPDSSIATASETVAGIAELATQTETDLGADDSRIVTPKKLGEWPQARHGSDLTVSANTIAKPTGSARGAWYEVTGPSGSTLVNLWTDTVGTEITLRFTTDIFVRNDEGSSGQILLPQEAQNFNAGLGDCVTLRHEESGKWRVIDIQNDIYNATGENPLMLAPLRDDFLKGFQIIQHSGDAAHDIQITPGYCRDRSDQGDIYLPNSIIKQIDATWAVGSNAGGRGSGVSLTNDTWYHLFVARNPATGVVDAFFDTNSSGSGAPSGYTLKRRIATLYYATAAWRDFTHAIEGERERFLWKTPVPDVNNTGPGTSAVLYPLSVPPPSIVGSITAIVFARLAHTASAFLCVTSPDQQADFVPSATTATHVTTASAQQAQHIMNINVDTSRQVRARCDLGAVSGFLLITHGWFDARGRNGGN